MRAEQTQPRLILGKSLSRISGGELFAPLCSQPGRSGLSSLYKSAAFFLLRLAWKMLFSMSSFPMCFPSHRKPCSSHSRLSRLTFSWHSDFIHSLSCFLVHITLSSFTSFLPLSILSETAIQTFESTFLRQSAQKQAHWTFFPYFKWVIIC